MVPLPERTSSSALLPERERCGDLSRSVLQVSLTCCEPVPLSDRTPCCFKPGIRCFQPRLTPLSLHLRGGGRLPTQLLQKDRDHVRGEARFLDKQAHRDRPPLGLDALAGVQQRRLALRRKPR